jgi:3-dehydroquinate synthase
MRRLESAFREMETFRVKSKNFTYPVVTGKKAWCLLRDLPQGRYSSIFVLTERPLWRRWRTRFVEESGLARARALFVPSGEQSKSLQMLEKLGGELLLRGADRRSCLILFGGGVIGDLGAFLASVYMRGVDCIHIPTTLLAQVDSSVGGKTAVNLGEMKNLIGTFHPGRMVLSDPRVLTTLQWRSFRSGLYEVIKHAVLDGRFLFNLLESSIHTFRPATAGDLESVVARAVKVKVDIVNRDEREANQRMTLNLGHTIGHALEEATGYSRFVHGEAVGWGLLAAARLGRRLGLLPEKDSDRISALVRRLGPLPSIQDIPPGRILSLLPQDKKAIAGEIHWVIPEKIGKVRVMTGVPRSDVLAVLADIQEMK